MYVTLPEHTATPVFPASPVKSKPRSPEFRIRTGKHLFHEGDDVIRLYQITQGEFRLSRLTENGRRQVIAFGYPGDIVGFPCDGLYHSDCEALTDAHVISYPVSLLDDAKREPELHQTLLTAALHEISAMQDHFMMLGQKSAMEKIASFLNVLAGRIGEQKDGVLTFPLSMPRADIADFIGLTTETVSRTLTQLRNSGVIAIENIQTVVILDHTALRTLAEGEDI